MKKMKGIIVIDLEEYQYVDCPPITVLSSAEVETYNICVTVKNNEKLKDIISRPSNKELLLRECITNLKASAEFKDQHKVYKYCSKMLKNGVDIISDCTSYSFIGSNGQIIRYLNDNPEIAQKPFYLPESYDLSWDDYERALCLYGNYPNARFLVNGNDTYRISLEEYKNTLEIIDEIVNKVNSFGFSNLEKIMYVYDYVRDRYYNQESKDENSYESRALTKVLFGDKIVCAGFVNLFNTILSRLKISCDEFILSSKNSKHARSLVYVCDPKYDVCGVYMFDPTFDCKKDIGIDHMLKYKYFAKTPKQMMEYDDGYFTYDSYPYFDEYMLTDMADIFDGDKIDYIELSETRLYSYVNYLMDLIGEAKLKRGVSYDADFVFEKLFYANKLSNEIIDCEKFSRLLYNVRKVQSKEDNIKYSKDLRILSVILARSCLPYPTNDVYQKILQDVCGYKNVSSSDAFCCLVSNILKHGALSEEEKGLVFSLTKRS